MNQWKLLPRLAIKGIWTNRMIYLPYALVGVVTSFIYFVFSSIMANKLVFQLPHAPYALATLQIGMILLILILIPFMYYAYSFLLKKRKKEFGLYHILGLEKKHIGMLIFLESLIVYVLIIICGIIVGIVFAKVMFLFLLRLTALPLSIKFTFECHAVINTMIVFAIIFLINFISALIQIGKTKPVELMSGSKKGEKEPKHVGIWGFLGILLIAAGYWISLTAKIDQTIFMRFFFSILFVVVGTYFLFTSGSILFLRLAKNNKKLYYQPENFITISGMLYRMKKNAASLSNICIFSTMVMITLICTISMGSQLDQIEKFQYPYDSMVEFNRDEKNKLSMEEWNDKVSALCDQHHVGVKNCYIYESFETRVLVNGNELINRGRQYGTYLYITTQDDYRKVMNRDLDIRDGNVVVFTTGKDWNVDNIKIGNVNLPVQKEVSEFRTFSKNVQNPAVDYVLIVKDTQAVKDLKEILTKEISIASTDSGESQDVTMYFLSLKGNRNAKESFVEAYTQWCSKKTNCVSCSNGIDGRTSFRVMDGSLIFIGLVFGIIFFICLLLIMYYKQISEGFEDQDHFSIMRKVGLSDEESQKTIKKQIMMVFGLPLLFALLHTIAGMVMFGKILVLLNLFDVCGIWICTGIVCGIFTVLYVICYLFTAKTYYRIVR